MSFSGTVGRCLLVTICVLSGIGKFSDPKPQERALSDMYSKTFAKVKEFGVVLPLAPEVVSLYAHQLIFLTAGLLLLGSVLTIFNKSCGPCILSTLLISFCIVIHNPYLYTKEKESQFHCQMILLNLGLVAGLFLSCGEKSEKKEKLD